MHRHLSSAMMIKTFCEKRITSLSPLLLLNTLLLQLSCTTMTFIPFYMSFLFTVFLHFAQCILPPFLVSVIAHHILESSKICIQHSSLSSAVSSTQFFKLKFLFFYHLLLHSVLFVRSHSPQYKRQLHKL